MNGSKRLGLVIVIAIPFETGKSKRHLRVAWLAALLAGCKRQLSSLSSIAFVVAVIVVGTGVLIMVVVAVLAEKA